MLNQYIEDLDRFSITQKVNTNNNAKIFLYDNDAYNTLFKTKSFEYEKFKQEREMREHNARALTFQEIKINKTKQIQLDNEIESKKGETTPKQLDKELEIKKERTEIETGRMALKQQELEIEKERLRLTQKNLKIEKERTRLKKKELKIIKEERIEMKKIQNNN